VKISVPFFFFRERQRDSSLGNALEWAQLIGGLISLPDFSRHGSPIIVLDESGRYCGPELFASMTAQGVNKNVLDRLAVGSTIAVHSAPALSGADMDPVCGSVGGNYRGHGPRGSRAAEVGNRVGRFHSRSSHDVVVSIRTERSVTCKLEKGEMRDRKKPQGKIPTCHCTKPQRRSILHLGCKADQSSQTGGHSCEFGNLSYRLEQCFASGVHATGCIQSTPQRRSQRSRFGMQDQRRFKYSVRISKTMG